MSSPPPSRAGTTVLATDADVEMQNAPHMKDEIMHPIAVLMDELKDPDTAIRLEAIKRLSTIALALGPERTRVELMQFLCESLMDEDDELLFHMAEELSRFIPLVGGPEHAHNLLPVLEALCAAEEPSIRTKTVETMVTILNALSPSQLETYFFPLLQRLSTASWYTNRMSAASLYPAAYTLSTSQDPLISSFILLLQDETPMVRRSAAIHFSDLLDNVTKSHLEILFSAFLRLLQDEQDSVRLLSVQIVFSFSSKMTQEERAKHLFPIIEPLFLDKSWRVRFVVAENFAALAAIIDQSQIDCTPIYLQYIQDYEAEVRSAALEQLGAFCKLISKETLEKTIIPALAEIVTDPSPYVRASFADHVTSLAPLLGKESSLSILMPLLIQLLEDDDSNVRLNVISKLEHVNQVVGIQILAVSLLPAVVKLSAAKQWRVRLAVVENIPVLALQLGIEFFNESFLDFSLSLLGDRAYAVRDAAIESFKKIMVQFGPEWTKEKALPRILEFAKHNNYLYRMTLLFAMNILSEVLDANVLCGMVLPVILSMAKDPVANVRFNVAKTLESISRVLGKRPDIGKVLDELARDEDTDVRYYAGKATATVDNLLRA